MTRLEDRSRAPRGGTSRAGSVGSALRSRDRASMVGGEQRSRRCRRTDRHRAARHPARSRDRGEPRSATMAGSRAPTLVNGKSVPATVMRRSPQAASVRQPVAAPDQSGDLVPVRFAVETHADPSLVADVRGHEEPLGIGPDQHHLAAGRRLAPQRDAPVATLLHGEDPLAHPEGRIAPGLLLHRFGQSQADRAQALDRRSRHDATFNGRRLCSLGRLRPPILFHVHQGHIPAAPGMVPVPGARPSDQSDPMPIRKRASPGTASARPKLFKPTR